MAGTPVLSNLGGAVHTDFKVSGTLDSCVLPLVHRFMLYPKALFQGWLCGCLLEGTLMR